MKTVTCVLLIAAAAVAEPPAFRSGRYRAMRQEVEREPTTPKVQEAAYPAAGYTPPVEFKLPVRQEILPPATSYGVPDNSYSAPLNVYFVPSGEYGAPVPPPVEPERRKEPEVKKRVEEVTTLAAVVDEKKQPKPKTEVKKEKLVEAPAKKEDIVSAKGAYYVLLPGAQLQRVQFETENDVRNMAYTAHLRYRDEDRAPIYVYSGTPAVSPPLPSAQYGVPAPATKYGAAAYIQLWK